jgi:hypothetical protein
MGLLRRREAVQISFGSRVVHPKLCNTAANGHTTGVIIALIAFVLSIIVAGMVVSGIPDSITDIQPEQRVMNREIYFINRPVGFLYFYVELLFGLFLIGVIAFATSIIQIM